MKELKVPEIGESITEAIIAKWLKAEGDSVEKDEPLVELETDKVTVELPAPVAGVLAKINRAEGETVSVGEVLGAVDEAATAAKPKEEAPPSPPQAAPEAAAAGEGAAQSRATDEVRVMPAARRSLAAHGLGAQEVSPTGPGRRLLKEDVERHAAGRDTQAPKDAKAPEDAKAPKDERLETPATGLEEVVPMSPIRRRIAERLVAAQREAALLTTFNEVDMSEVMRLRREYRDSFEARHGVRLGFMSFFVRACIDALRQFPQLNATVSGTDIVYRNYFDIGIAVSTKRGLVVPVLRRAERMAFSEIELAIGDFASRARESKIQLHELQGGTFTITNGGVFGSMLSTPIVNPPQSGVLGLHAIEERPVAVQGEVVIHPMMYVALTYDHRIVDGREAVTFLRRIKESIADPARLLLEV